MITEDMMTVLTECRMCNEEHEIQVPVLGYQRWKYEGALIQDAFPRLSADQRELLISQTCGTCFASIFAGNDEDDDGGDGEEYSISTCCAKNIPINESIINNGMCNECINPLILKQFVDATSPTTPSNDDDFIEVNCATCDDTTVVHINYHTYASKEEIANVQCVNCMFPEKAIEILDDDVPCTCAPGSTHDMKCLPTCPAEIAYQSSLKPYAPLAIPDAYLVE